MDARHPFDGMPPPGRSGGEDEKAVAPGPGCASLDVLPDEVLCHVLSFLPAQEAVWTCVLARRWRHLWRSAPGLRILCGDENEAASMEELREFVENLFLQRGGSSLDTCQLSLLNLDDDNDYDVRRIHHWIQHVLLCRVRVLSINIVCRSNYFISRFYLNNDQAIVSQHLKRLELCSLHLSDTSVDFSSCPTLEVLEIKDCDISDLVSISSQSLKCLSIDSNCSFSQDHRIDVYTPNLVSLWLQVFFGRSPILERMPCLVDAFVELDATDGNFCHDAMYGDCEDERCSCCHGVDGDTDCRLLEGLSEAHSLVLRSYTGMFIFRRDLKCCPIFSNLKTLSVDEYWCIPEDFSALTRILEHSPVLEKLTLQLLCEGPKSNVQMKGCHDPTERSNAISIHLKVVEVKCEVVDNRVLDVLKFLDKLGKYSYRFEF